MGHYRAAWISDIHLGTRGCKAEAVLEFIKNHQVDTLYLVGDILDIWALKRGIYWPQAHNDVLQKLLRTSRKGTKLIYIPGNHDEFVQKFSWFLWRDPDSKECDSYNRGWTADPHHSRA